MGIVVTIKVESEQLETYKVQSGDDQIVTIQGVPIRVRFNDDGVPSFDTEPPNMIPRELEEKERHQQEFAGIWLEVHWKRENLDS